MRNQYLVGLSTSLGRVLSPLTFSEHVHLLSLFFPTTYYSTLYPFPFCVGRLKIIFRKYRRKIITNCTHPDYLHITKRFGHVAASQFPIHYMLSMKSYTAPLTVLLQTSHEELNPWHRITGRIIYFLLLNHGSWYMNFFVQADLLSTRLTALVVIIGITAFSLLTVIATSSLSSVRKWNYRVFFLLHLFIGVSLPPLLFFHAPELRVYMIEAFALFIIDIICRKLDTVTGYATITKVPNTKLVKMKILMPATKLDRFRAAPGQHVYLNIPPESTPPNTSSPSIHDTLYNPFTVADVSATDITLVLRSLRGPTTNALETLAALTKARPPINIEGPYGSSRRFPNLISKYDRILLVAGGVGATFTLPIYRDLRDQLETEGKSPDNIKFIWSMRSSAETAWASQSPESGISLADDESVNIFFTRGTSPERYHADEVSPADGSVEMHGIRGSRESIGAGGVRDRCDLRKIVDETFKHSQEESVAVLVCGPTKMARELRNHVGRWVGRGREVFWHDESFGL
jgi:NAD(P)H-flavin reductase